MKTTALILLTLLFMAFSCKKPTKSGLIECDPGYHPNADSTNCLIDTTSHNFTWTIDTLGIYGSYLNDVAVVNENNIWVVGNIETDSGSYNAARWNGEEWELKLIVNSDPLYSIYYFNENDIWVTTYSYPIHWDGQEWTLTRYQDIGINVSAGQAIWGTSTNDLYFVGVNGGIVHYDGVNFVKMDSGTDVDLKDIAGTPDGEHVFAVGYDETYPGRSIILSFDDGQWSTFYYCEGVLPSESCQGAINTCMDVIGDTAYFILGFVGLWKYNYLTGESNIIPENEIYFSNRGFRGLKGQGVNDISFIANWGELVHYNGSTWYLDTTVLDYFGPYNIQVKGLDFNGNVIVSVGYHWAPGGAFVARGYRY